MGYLRKRRPHLHCAPVNNHPVNGPPKCWRSIKQKRTPVPHQHGEALKKCINSLPRPTANYTTSSAWGVHLPIRICWKNLGRPEFQDRLQHHVPRTYPLHHQTSIWLLTSHRQVWNPWLNVLKPGTNYQREARQNRDGIVTEACRNRAGIVTKIQFWKAHWHPLIKLALWHAISFTCHFFLVATTMHPISKITALWRIFFVCHPLSF